MYNLIIVEETQRCILPILCYASNTIYLVSFMYLHLKFKVESMGLGKRKAELVEYNTHSQ